MKKFLIILLFVLIIPAQIWAADAKITELTEDTTPTTDDLLLTVDDPGGATPANKKVTIGNLQKAYKGYLWIPSGSMVPDTCSGLSQFDTGTSIIDYLAFDPSTEEFAEFHVALQDWNAGTVKVKFYWTVASGIAGTNGDDVLWDIKCGSANDGETVDVTYGDVVEVTDEYATADETGPKLKISPASAAITVAGSPGAGHLLTCRVSRNSDAAGDEYDAGATSDLWLIGIMLEYGKTTPTAW